MTIDYSKAKEFRDSVHGYISIPVEFCEKFIDTAVFKERLYRIASSHKNASGMHKFVSEGRKLQQEVNATKVV